MRCLSSGRLCAYKENRKETNMSIVKDGVMLVTYETECSTICEYMTETEFNILKKDELNGKIRIMGHRNLSYSK